jgi:hypothetical protein
VTREDIEKMEAGRELDFLVAVNVMNLCVLDTLQSYGDGCVMSDKGMDEWFKHSEYGKIADPDSLEPYSANISAAWEVMEKFDRYEIGLWEGKVSAALGTPGYYAHGETAQLAICRAALLAVMNL